MALAVGAVTGAPSLSGIAFEHAPEGPPALAAGETQVLSVDLDAAPEPFLELLAPDERERAARFRFDVHRRRFVVAHGALRRVLARELGVQPAELEFEAGKHGKPALTAHPDLHFNLSHSAGLALVALSREGPLGVDVEERRPVKHAETIARRYFSPAEIEAFDALPADERLAAFYRCWTRKEAYLKATGEGLSLPLDGFDVTLGPDEPARLLRVGALRGAATGWSLYDLRPSPQHAAALVSSRARTVVRAWHWPASNSAPSEA